MCAFPRVCSEQAASRRIDSTAECCLVPHLTWFTAANRARPIPQHSLLRRRPHIYSPQNRIPPLLQRISGTRTRYLPGWYGLILRLAFYSFCYYIILFNELQEDNQIYTPYTALSPSSASMRSSRLYFATRSYRHGAPVLMNPALVATAISAIDVSPVSPDR